MKTFRIALLLLLGAVVAAAALVLIVVTRHDLLVSRDAVALQPMTAEERVEDVAFLLDLVRDSYPFVGVIEHEKGLGDFWGDERRYLQAAERASSNREFVRLVAEIVQRLEQGAAHCDLVAPEPNATESELRLKSLAYGVSMTALHLRQEWWELLDPGSRYTHAELPTVYRDGAYVMTDDTEVNGRTVPAGAVVTAVDGLPADAYVKSLRDRLWLRFDAHLGKVYSHHSPFLVAGDRGRDHWTVELTAPDGPRDVVRLAKQAGYQGPPGVHQPDDNVVCAELDDRTAYVKVGVFLPTWLRAADFDKVVTFLEASHGRYETLILDIRGNLGGAPSYWEDLFLRRLISEPVTAEHHSIVKRGVFEALGVRRWLFDAVYGDEVDLGQGQRVDFEAWPFGSLPRYLDPEAFELRRNTKTYEPVDPLPFDGEIYLLVDHDCFSAAEDFAKTAKQLGFATLVGAHTIGGAAVALPPWLFELPNSRLLLSLELDLAFNDDGQINEVVGTMPDVVLATSAFPTPYPEGYDVASLRSDPWIAWVLRQSVGGPEST